MDDLPEADFWPGITSDLPVIHPQSLANLPTIARYSNTELSAAGQWKFSTSRSSAADWSYCE